jgi:hypothetical protein
MVDQTATAEEPAKKPVPDTQDVELTQEELDKVTGGGKNAIPDLDAGGNA